MRKHRMYAIIALALMFVLCTSAVQAAEETESAGKTTISTVVPERGGSGGGGSFQESQYAITVTFNEGGIVVYGSTNVVSGNAVWITKGNTATFGIAAQQGYTYTVVYNGVDVTAQVQNNLYTTAGIQANGTLQVTFQQDSNAKPPKTGDAPANSWIGFAMIAIVVVIGGAFAVVAWKNKKKVNN